MIKPQLVNSAKNLPSRGEWLYELKFDGFRILAFIEQGNVRLVTRGQNDFTTAFPRAVDMLKNLPNCVLDGEIVCDKFPPTHQGIFIAFDILFFGEKDLRELPLIERKAILETIDVNQSDYLENITKVQFQKICAQNHEGIIAKLRDSTYQGSRSGAWLKLKCPNYMRINSTKPQL